MVSALVSKEVQKLWELSVGRAGSIWNRNKTVEHFMSDEKADSNGYGRCHRSAQHNSRRWLSRRL